MTQDDLLSTVRGQLDRLSCLACTASMRGGPTRYHGQEGDLHVLWVDCPTCRVVHRAHVALILEDGSRYSGELAPAPRCRIDEPRPNVQLPIGDDDLLEVHRLLYDGPLCGLAELVAPPGVGRGTGKPDQTSTAS